MILISPVDSLDILSTVMSENIIFQGSFLSLDTFSFNSHVHTLTLLALNCSPLCDLILHALFILNQDLLSVFLTGVLLSPLGITLLNLLLF